MKLSRRQWIKTSVGALVVPRLLGCGSDQALWYRTEGTKRIIDCNGIPDHPTGMFPNPGCPIAIRPQRHHYEMPLEPVAAADFTPAGWSEVGVAITGVPFDPAGPYWQGDASLGWRFEVMSTVARPFLGLDFENAHVQPSGAYHYHGFPDALRTSQPLALAGFAADGFPIYAQDGALQSSYRLRSGARPSGPGGNYDGTFVEDYEYVAGLGDLDEANGRTAATPEFPRGTYHYVLADAFPFIPRMFRGTPDTSFVHGGDPGLAALPPGLRDYHG